MEASLNKAILIQFVVSTNANCAGFLIMVTKIYIQTFEPIWTKIILNVLEIGL